MEYGLQILELGFDMPFNKFPSVEKADLSILSTFNVAIVNSNPPSYEINIFLLLGSGIDVWLFNFKNI
jgi:hypothetical protein